MAAPGPAPALCHRHCPGLCGRAQAPQPLLLPRCLPGPDLPVTGLLQSEACCCCPPVQLQCCLPAGGLGWAQPHASCVAWASQIGKAAGTRPAAAVLHCQRGLESQLPPLLEAAPLRLGHARCPAWSGLPCLPGQAPPMSEGERHVAHWRTAAGAQSAQAHRLSESAAGKLTAP